MTALQTEPFALRAPLRERAMSVARAIGDRLLVEMDGAPFRDVNDERYPNTCMNGTVGYALAFLALAQSTGDARFEAGMHEQLQRAARAGAGAAGLFDGVSGLRAVSALAAAIEPRYGDFVRRCDEYVESKLPSQPVQPQWWGEYDVISGWSGMRLARCVSGDPGEDRLTELLDWLVCDDDRWAAADEPGARPHRWLGMAHGISGVLATLATSRAAIPAARREHLTRLASFLMKNVRDVGGRPVWARAAGDPGETPHRSVWCVGSLGVATALLQTAAATGDRATACFAHGVLVEWCDASGEELRAVAQGICHGTIGAALVYFWAARKTGDALFADACERLIGETLDGLDAAEGRCWSIGVDGVRYDALGELLGVAGVATALVTMCGEFDERWMVCHALAP